VKSKKCWLHFVANPYQKVLRFDEFLPEVDIIVQVPEWKGCTELIDRKM
jgi:hypothetical protein